MGRGHGSSAVPRSSACNSRSAPAVVRDSVNKWTCPLLLVAKNIEDLEVGDNVLAWDEATGRQELQPIDRTYRRIADHLRVLTIRSGDGREQILQTTNEHPFWLAGQGWVNAGDLEAGDNLLQPDGETATLIATAFEPHPEGMPVFNLRVEERHTYFVSDAGASSPLLVHNANYEGRNPNPIGKRYHFNSKKQAREAAQRAGHGAPPRHDATGPYGPHYHPDVPMPPSGGQTPHMPNPHDHCYYGGG